VVDVPPPGPKVALTLTRSAELYGAYRWMERRLFELTGSWAAEAVEPEVRLHLDVVSGQHAWHAELWEARLPMLDGTDREALTRPGGPVAEPLFGALSEPATTVERLAGLYRVVVPRLLVTYHRHLQRAAPVADAPAVRALRLVRRDEVESWEAGEHLLQELLAGPEDAAVAAAVQARLETPVAGSGVGSGLLPWPDETAGASD
jgi:hypothetical protein